MNVEELYHELLAKAEMLYQYAIAQECEKAKSLAKELLKHEVFTWTYADDLRFYINTITDYACRGVGNVELLYKWLKRGIWGHLSKSYGPLPYPD